MNVNDTGMLSCKTSALYFYFVCLEMNKKCLDISLATNVLLVHVNKIVMKSPVHMFSLITLSLKRKKIMLMINLVLKNCSIKRCSLGET